MTELYELEERAERLVLVGVAVGDEVTTQDSLTELAELVQTAGGLPVGQFIQNRAGFDIATYIGSGKVAELKQYLIMMDADGIVCYDELTPSQMNNLERELEVKILDPGRAGTAAISLDTPDRYGRDPVQTGRWNRYQRSRREAAGD